MSNVSKEQATEEEMVKDKENAKREYLSNMSMSYKIKNRGLDIKIDAMDILHKRLVELNDTIDSQEGDRKLKTLAVMAEIGKAIIPD